MRLLVIEDSPILREHLVLGLREAGYVVDTAVDGDEGLWAAREIDYDALLVDAMLPGMHGFELVRAIRALDRTCAILMLTALGGVTDRIAALDLGADDYLAKPFDFGELLARLRAVLRRRYGQASATIEVGPLSIDTLGKQVSMDEQPVTLRPREYAVLEYLAQRPNQVIAASELESHLYDERAELSSNTIEAAISLLRKAIDRPGRNALIQTKRGHGYVLVTR